MKQNMTKIKESDELVNASNEIVFQNEKKEKRATALIVAEKKINQLEELLENNFKEVSDYRYALDESSIIAITDQKGIIKKVNSNFCKISKYSEQELIGQDHRIINSGYHSKEFIRDLWLTIANGKIWKGELKNKAKDGTIYWVDTTIVPFLNEQGKPYQYLAIRADITERKKIEEYLLQRTAQLEIANKNLRTFTHISNHHLQIGIIFKRIVKSGQCQYGIGNINGLFATNDYPINSSVVVQPAFIGNDFNPVFGHCF